MFIPKQIKTFKNGVVYATESFEHDDVFYTWSLKNGGEEQVFKYTIIPDTCIDIVFTFTDRLTNPVISKPFSTPTQIELKGKFNYFGIRFKPGKIMKYLWFELDKINDDFGYLFDTKKEFDSIDDFMNIFTNFNPGNFDKSFKRFAYDPEQILNSDLSSKQKSRLFEKLTGFNINIYKKIQKFHSSLDDPYLHFYDQSHYIKTFKDLTTLNPTEFYKDFSI